MTWVFLVLFLHVGVLALFLLQGCKNEEPAKPVAETPPPPTLAPDTNSSPALGGLPPTPPPPGVPSGATPAPNFALPTGGGAPGAGQPLPPAGGGFNPPPTPPPTPVIADPAPTTPSTEHIVVKGDTGVTIAKKYGMGWKAIEAANPGVDARRLKIGQKLIIPAKSISTAPPHADHAADGATGSETVYTVKSGDTLGKIAKSHGVTVKALQAANGLKTTGIAVGKKLKIPAKTAPATATPGTDTIAPPPSISIPSLPPPAPGLLPDTSSPGSSLPPPPRR
ncbi:MAG: LysM peptidoglycan-binding domain-containing protein [Verrucomicrobia bacterium]|nr:LysM peptidoglycan-binding domain-containing protein [Verrucomicrobiota bacterium]MBI3867731.1 LysM peptidoglycan-binding domain-containing protein [Verrucomicrobiota bacterium]